MLVHKRTMGVLDRIWTGEYRRGPSGLPEPADRPATLDDVEEPGDWWEVSSIGPMAKVIRMYYPWMVPRVDGAGNLVGVTAAREAQAKPEAPSRAQDAARRGYQEGRRLRPTGLMPFLRASRGATAGADQPNTEGPLSPQGEETVK